LSHCNHRIRIKAVDLAPILSSSLGRTRPGHNKPVSDIKRRITELADLMSEFHLQEAQLEGENWKVAFRKTPAPTPSGEAPHGAAPGLTYVAAEPEKPKGTPVSSPMNGVYYAAPNPGAAPFVQVGDVVSAGQVVGLIEAMKVFNEITSPVTGTIGLIIAENGQLVQPGEPLFYVE
jgi:acetyl-CoA carboxylase biotin carboxyl carrier protein